MALSLKAEQKNLIKLLETEDIYVIPSYQRPYSWGYEQCDQLYKDITDAFNNYSDYFLGNIIIARSEDDNIHPNIVDGQQRIITLYLIVKILTVLCPYLKKYNRYLYVEDSREENKYPKIDSRIYETDDHEEIIKILSLDIENIHTRYHEISIKNTPVEEKCKSRLEYNFYILYKWFNTFQNNTKGDGFDKFVEFFFRKVYLLPIELNGKTIDEANDKALTIFETINNRGMNLEDADILKARLYDKAKNVEEQDKFIELWSTIKRDCLDLNISIDDLFRYYYHILRGEYNNTAPEKKLRDYFIKDDSSPLHHLGYLDILNHLNKIIDVLQLIEAEMSYASKNLVWLKVLYAYSNLYPRYALVAYLYANDFDCNSQHFSEFIESLTRYVYGKGSTSTIKFEIYNIIRDVVHHKRIASYKYDKTSADILNWKRISPIRRGFIILAFYLINKHYKYVTQLNIDRIIPIKEIYGSESIGNFILLTCAKSRGDWKVRRDIYETRCADLEICDQWNFADNVHDANHLIQIRTEKINNVLSAFFYNE